ncbi:MAG: hypothetical protein KTR35_19570, partial [Gammaproteobacteria bacterium]|nr:hypothetical protein [Gammaproteobacteria bacterium]
YRMKIEKEMGFTHADFFRLLPRAMGETPFEINGLVVNCRLPTGSLRITLGEERERRLVLLVLPCTSVTLEFEDVMEEDRERFLKYFNLRFMKGLG